MKSPPSRRRGLKLKSVLPILEFVSRLLRGGVDWNCSVYAHPVQVKVASFAEAWIEILKSDVLSRSILSPPSRRRGLKLWLSKLLQNLQCRLLRGGVDWNNIQRHLRYFRLVASFAEAWIEILKDTRKDELFTSPPSRRRGLKSNISEETLVGTISRLLRGGVDWNTVNIGFCWLCIRRLLRGGVDWNQKKSPLLRKKFGRLLRGGVDWNCRLEDGSIC